MAERGVAERWIGGSTGLDREGPSIRPSRRHAHEDRQSAEIREPELPVHAVVRLGTPENAAGAKYRARLTRIQLPAASTSTHSSLSGPRPTRSSS
jgi:hypothetical protein